MARPCAPPDVPPGGEARRHGTHRLDSPAGGRLVTVDGRLRPQLWRSGSESLDGEWDFAPDPAGRWDEPDEVEWSTTIQVPFAPGTAASGVPEGDPGLVWW